MQIEIQARDFSLTSALRSHIKRRVGYAFSSYQHYIEYIDVRLSDINGPRGGSDKRCQLHIVLPNHTNIIVMDTEPDLYVAIDRATDRARRAVARKIVRQRHKAIRSRLDNIPSEQSNVNASLS